MASLYILATGGTFDKRFDEDKGFLVLGESLLPDLIARARVTVPYILDTLFPIDGYVMTEADRQRVVSACRARQETRILIVHGTDTMCETAKALGHTKLPQTVVLTGAMMPYETEPSNAAFNFGAALASVQLLPPNIYVAMNGSIFTWDNVRKNGEKRTFETLH